MNRRDILKKGGLLSLGLFSVGLARAAEAAGIVTPAQTEGPFYPVVDQVDKDVDMIHVQGHGGTAKGQVIRVGGTVQDAEGNPLANTQVEVWQACHSGKYNHPDDTNTAELDPDFQYWGRTTTDAKGRYAFLTIKPGAYPADSTWTRPPHIHFKVAAPGFRSLTTQMYFEGDALNEKDRILRALKPEGRKAVTVKFTQAPGNQLQGTFDIVIGRLGQREGTPELE